MSMTCGEATMRLLAGYGVTTVFAIPGVHTVACHPNMRSFAGPRSEMSRTPNASSQPPKNASRSTSSTPGTTLRRY